MLLPYIYIYRSLWWIVHVVRFVGKHSIGFYFTFILFCCAAAGQISHPFLVYFLPSSFFCRWNLKRFVVKLNAIYAQHRSEMVFMLLEMMRFEMCDYKVRLSFLWYLTTEAVRWAVILRERFVVINKRQNIENQITENFKSRKTVTKTTHIKTTERWMLLCYYFFRAVSVLQVFME